MSSFKRIFRGVTLIRQKNGIPRFDTFKTVKIIRPTVAIPVPVCTCISDCGRGKKFFETEKDKAFFSLRSNFRSVKGKNFFPFLRHRKTAAMIVEVAWKCLSQLSYYYYDMSRLTLAM